MHVRGSSLSQPQVIEALRPFIVAFWGQANDEPIPADLRPLYAASNARGSNVTCFVLDAGGRLLHSFNGFPGQMGNPTAYSREQYAAYFAGEITRGAARLSQPPPARRDEELKLRLPEPTNGVRLFVRLPYARDSYSYPVVETVENRDEWATLAYPTAEREIDAAKLSRWLRLCYPPGVNEQLEPFGVVKGKLTLTPAGKDQAILSGKIRLARSATDYDIFQGTLEAVVTYASASKSTVSLRAVVDGTYWRFDRYRNGWMDWKLVAAIEHPVP